MRRQRVFLVKARVLDTPCRHNYSPPCSGCTQCIYEFLISLPYDTYPNDVTILEHAQRSRGKGYAIVDWVRVGLLEVCNGEVLDFDVDV